MTGILYLMNGPEATAQHNYKGPQQRDKIIETWHKSWGLKFLQLWIKDVPDENVKEKSPFKKGSVINPIKINRQRTCKKSTKGGSIW